MKRGGCVLITQPQAIQQPRSVCGGGEGEGEGEVVEQQTRALGNPCSSFSSSSSSLCIRRGFDKNIFSLVGGPLAIRSTSSHPSPPHTVGQPARVMFAFAPPLTLSVNLPTYEYRSVDGR